MSDETGKMKKRDYGQMDDDASPTPTESEQGNQRGDTKRLRADSSPASQREPRDTVQEAPTDPDDMEVDSYNGEAGQDPKESDDGHDMLGISVKVNLNYSNNASSSFEVKVRPSLKARDLIVCMATDEFSSGFATAFDGTRSITTTTRRVVQDFQELIGNEGIYELLRNYLQLEGVGVVRAFEMEYRFGVVNEDEARETLGMEGDIKEALARIMDGRLTGSWSRSNIPIGG
ncbi:hypothetical protein GE09DRAFT_1209884 [Coniochaeta sp. 2T2.1]|nr:hypothetical protein GE09DRAFT_1209884 [Coniochaeta sp. 2T2.1]